MVADGDSMFLPKSDIFLLVYMEVHRQNELALQNVHRTQSAYCRRLFFFTEIFTSQTSVQNVLSP
jgi:hypothetical protein